MSRLAVALLDWRPYPCEPCTLLSSRRFCSTVDFEGCQPSASTAPAPPGWRTPAEDVGGRAIEEAAAGRGTMKLQTKTAELECKKAQAIKAT
eukprot:1152290-Pelagomonas_calceolata.AAC.2